jgi:hypothetical protein
MNGVTIQAQVREERPSCFGKLWNPNETECNGGPDPKYNHPKNGSHIRERCDFFNECGARVQSEQLISPQQMIRPPVITPPPAATPRSFQEYMRQRDMSEAEAERIRRATIIQQQQQQQRPVQVPYYPQPVQQPQIAYPQPIYQQMMPVNYQMPSYLSVPEMRMPGQSFMGLLGREAVRAMGKSVGHTVANFFDMNPFRLPLPPGGDQQK